MSEIQNVTVLGTGVLGSQIVMQAAYAGKDVIAYDISQELLDKLPERWEWMRGHYRDDLTDYSDRKFDAALARITTSTDLTEAVADADVVIEAVPENLDLKKDVWGRVGAAVKDSAILLTNSSSLRPSDFGGATGRTDRFLALHFANMVWKSNTGEVMATPETDPAVFTRTVEFAREINLQPFPVHKETPGYLLNSLLIPWLNAAAELYVNKVANPAVVDADWKVSTGAPNGPFEFYDVVGFNVAYNIIQGSQPEGSPLRAFAEELKVKGIDAGRTGIADGVGFYEYDSGAVIRPNPDWVLFEE